MSKKLIVLLLAVSTFFSCKNKNEQSENLPDGLYAEIKTDKGDITVQLDYEKNPITVANFITLAEGKNAFVKPEYKGKPFYDGLNFHRVINDFMIQGGDPLGDGTGDPGYKFKDEITDQRFEEGGLLAMANSGPGTNGSQFFITHVPTPWLDGKHTIFGRVVANGMEVVNQIAQDDKIISVTIIRKGAGAKKFNAEKIFNDYFKVEAVNQKIRAAEEAKAKAIYEEKYKKVLSDKVAYFKGLKAGATKTKSGLLYKIVQKGKGEKPSAGTQIHIDYSGYFQDGLLFDSSNAEIAKAYGKYDPAREAQGGYTPIPFEAGRKQGMIPGFLEAISLMHFGDKMVVFIPSDLAYGEAGAGGVIPPNANLIFEIELKEAQ